ARASLAAALKTEGAGDLPWRTFASLANMELNDPYAYFIPKAEALQADRQFDAALGMASKGVDAFKSVKKDGIMLGLRSVLRIEAAHAKDNTRVDPKDPVIEAARKDAEAAIAAGAAAQGNFALGRIAEELGQYDVAQKHYQAAMKEHPDNDRFGAQVRVALARVIIKARERAAVDNRQGLAAPTVEEQPVDAEAARPVVLYHPLSLMIAARQVGQVMDDDFDPNDPALDEAIRLAEEAIKQGNYEGHLVKAMALAQKRRYTDAILEYSLGLSKLSKNPEHAEGLRKLMEMHPAFKIPDGLLPPDPLLAERHYANGLRHYWARRYADAEGEFLTAVRYHDQDARYMYFLGLARLNQNKREFALEAFRRGGILETQKKPNRASVSATLERIQGSERELINRYRP
ncbi:MAG: tetratricopeptide repeat protein, partial [Gemmataceae bacterium]